MYGADLKTLAAGEARPLLNFFGDDQISFRSLILAGVNWYKFVAQAKRGGGGTYVYSPVPIFANLTGNDVATSPYKTTYDAWELANSPYAVVDGKRAIEIPYEANQEALREIRESDSYKGGGRAIYTKLQDAMTALLDRVYAKEG